MSNRVNSSTESSNWQTLGTDVGIADDVGSAVVEKCSPRLQRLSRRIAAQCDGVTWRGNQPVPDCQIDSERARECETDV